MYQVILHREAKKDLKKLETRFRDKVFLMLYHLKSDPFVGEKMAGDFKGSYRIKIPPLRIIYTPDFKSKIIWVKAIGFRGGIYNK